MDRKNSQKRPKRPNKGIEENVWDCSVCTFRNTAEAFKCAMCDVRKGTSTRKPRLNPQLVAQQVAQQLTTTPPKPRREESKERKSSHLIGSQEEKPSKKKVRNIRPRLKNIDRTKAHRHNVTVNNVTVVITEYLPKAAPSASQGAPALSLDVPPSSSGMSNHSGISMNGEVHPATH